MDSSSASADGLRNAGSAFRGLHQRRKLSGISRWSASDAFSKTIDVQSLEWAIRLCYRISCYKKHAQKTCRHAAPVSHEQPEPTQNPHAHENDDPIQTNNPPAVLLDGTRVPPDRPFHGPAGFRSHAESKRGFSFDAKRRPHRQ